MLTLRLPITSPVPWHTWSPRAPSFGLQPTRLAKSPGFAANLYVIHADRYDFCSRVYSHPFAVPSTGGCDKLVGHRRRTVDQLPVVGTCGQVASAWSALGGSLLGQLGTCKLVHVERCVATLASRSRRFAYAAIALGSLHSTPPWPSLRAADKYCPMSFNDGAFAALTEIVDLYLIVSPGLLLVFVNVGREALPWTPNLTTVRHRHIISLCSYPLRCARPWCSTTRRSRCMPAGIGKRLRPGSMRCWWMEPVTDR